MKILIAVFILICIVAIVVTGYIMDSTTLSPEETGAMVREYIAPHVAEHGTLSEEQKSGNGH